VEFGGALYAAPEVAYPGFLIEDSGAVGGLFAVWLAKLEVQLGSCFVAHPDFLPFRLNTRKVGKISAIFVVLLQTLCHK
jgi:hypothetical protein